MPSVTPTTFGAEHLGLLVLIISGLGVMWKLVSVIKELRSEVVEIAGAEAHTICATLLTKHDGDDDAHPKMVRSWERKRDDRLHEVLSSLTETIRITVLDAANQALNNHDRDPLAHRVASECNHGPMNATLTKLADDHKKIEMAVARLRDAHNSVAESGKHRAIGENE